MRIAVPFTDRHINIGRNKTVPKDETVPASNSAPIRGGRVSQPPMNDMFSILKDEATQVTAEFELDMLRICNYLAKFNGDVSYAVDNIVQLGNTPYSITFDEGVTDDQAKEMTSFINKAGKGLYNGGLNSLINDLYAQVAINGALSAEMIPNASLKGLQTIALVSPITIRFKYNKTTYLYDPYQTANSIISGAYGTENLIQLNTSTYKYYALRRFNDNPYGIPEFIAAFEMITLEKDMICNMRSIIKKLGTFGFLNVLVNAPTPIQNEKPIEYETRLIRYLESIKNDVSDGYANGIVVGFKNSHEFKVEGNELNVEGFHQLMELVTQMKMAGLKQDPLMLGRNFNVAETMARVIMAKLVTKIGNFQRLVAAFLEDIFKMLLVMGGFKVNNILVEFESPMVGDKLREEQAYEMRILNRKELRATGVISQQQYAQEVNYEKPFADKDVDYTVQHKEDKPFVDPNANKGPATDPNQVEDPTGSGATNYKTAEFILSMGSPEFKYGDRVCKCGTGMYSNTDRTIEKLVLTYLNKSRAQYSQSVTALAKLIADDFKKNGTGGSVQAMQDRVIYLLYNNWSEYYSSPQDMISKAEIAKLYKELTKQDDDLTEAYLLLSARTLKYFQQSDQFFLGRFISDVDTKRRLSNFVVSSYAEVLPDTFETDLAHTMESEAWKIDRVIDTTVNKLENITNLIRMSNAGDDQFILVSVKDSKRCNYCASMDGKIFLVESSMTKLKKLLDGGPNTINLDAPFITELFTGSEGEIKVGEMSGEELQAAGFIGFSSHPHCRCVLKKLT